MEVMGAVVTLVFFFGAIDEGDGAGTHTTNTDS